MLPWAASAGGVRLPVREWRAVQRLLRRAPSPLLSPVTRILLAREGGPPLPLAAGVG